VKSQTQLACVEALLIAGAEIIPSGVIRGHAAADLFDTVVDDRCVKREVPVLLPMNQCQATDKFDFEWGSGLELGAEVAEEALVGGVIFAGDGLAVLGKDAVLESVARGVLLTSKRFRAGGLEGVAAIGGDLLFGSHGGSRVARGGSAGRGQSVEVVERDGR
jgi:hypothetical protein